MRHGKYFCSGRNSEIGYEQVSARRAESTHVRRMRQDRLTTLAAKYDTNPMVREHAVCGTLFQWRHSQSTHFNSLDLFPRAHVVMGGVAILGSR
jgi:hypothetical protein